MIGPKIFNINSNYLFLTGSVKPLEGRVNFNSSYKKMGIEN